MRSQCYYFCASRLCLKSFKCTQGPQVPCLQYLEFHYKENGQTQQGSYLVGPTFWELGVLVVLPLQLSPASLLLRSSCVPSISRRNRTGTQIWGLAVPIFKTKNLEYSVVPPQLTPSPLPLRCLSIPFISKRRRHTTGPPNICA